MIKEYVLWRPNPPDEADNHLIELALAGTATEKGAYIGDCCMSKLARMG